MNASASATPLPVSEQDRLGSIALDQWRGLALVLVLISHGFYFTDRVNGIGRVGVNLFFFISGILVFRSLSRARERTGWSQTKSFWWRRLRRLYPAMLIYALAILPVVWLMRNRPNLPPGSDFGTFLATLPAALGCVMNLGREVPVSALGHLWSIDCEMQFYLLAPAIYLLGGATDKRRNLFFGILLVVLAGLGLAQPFIGRYKFHFVFAVWPMMLGFFCEYKRDGFAKISPTLVTLVLWLGAAVGSVSLLAMFFYPGAKLVVVAAGALLLAPCLLAYLTGRPLPGISGRVLKWLGVRTYSIYLWQEPFTICGFLPSILQPVGALVSVAVGAVWFHWFERPFLSAGRQK